MRHQWNYNGIQWEQIIFGILLILIISALAFIIFILMRRKENKPAGLIGNQANTLGNIKGLVCSMLAQSGGGLRQYEIGAHLGLPINIVSEKLNELEKQGVIKREWKNDEYTYFVSRPKDDETAGDDT